MKQTLIFIVTLAGHGDAKSAFWAVARCVSPRWAVYSNNVFPAPEANRSDSIPCFVAGVIQGIPAFALVLFTGRCSELEKAFAQQ